MKMNKSTFKFQSVHLWKHDKLFKQRKKWLLVFLKHISRNPPSSKQRVNERDLIEYKRTAFQLDFMEPEEWKQWIYKIKHSQQKSGFFGKRNKSEKGTLHDLDEIMDEMEQKELKTTTASKHEQINSISMAQDDVEIVAIKKHASEISVTSSMNFSLSLSKSENEKIFINMADIEGETALHWEKFLDLFYDCCC